MPLLSQINFKKLKYYDVSKPNGVFRKVIDVSLAKNMAGHKNRFEGSYIENL